MIRVVLNEKYLRRCLTYRQEVDWIFSSFQYCLIFRINVIMPKLILVSCFLFCSGIVTCQKAVPVKPRILISTDIGGSDPDDNQSMIHFLMYSNRFNTEGLISSPSYGHGSKQNILEMIALYEKDLPKLKAHGNDFPSPDLLRSI